MEVLLSALLGELASRSVSFLLSRCAAAAAAPPGEAADRRLQRMLLRARAAVEEADRRRVANQAMLLQLAALREAMYSGYLALDTFRCHASLSLPEEEEEARRQGAVVTSRPNSLVFSKLNPFNHEVKEVEVVLQSLEKAMADMSESLVFLVSYPVLYRQPYSVHLFLDRCMFGRHAEMERVMSFLLRADPPVGYPDVLPIVGPRGVGKSTLVEHVCIDERVRDHFSRVVYFSESDLKGKTPTCSLVEGGVTRHRRSDALAAERSLAIVELAGDMDGDGIWSTVYSACKHRIPGCSKVIVTSRSEKITSALGLGTTTLPLILSFLPREAYWYFFKVLVFGSADPEEQPGLAAIAMGIFEELSGTFLIANIIASLLRANVSPEYWRRIHARVREWREKNLFGAQPSGTWSTSTPTYLRRIDRASQHWVIRRQYQVDGSNQVDVPVVVPIQEAILRNVKPLKKVEILAWTSHVPPCLSYMFSCEVLEQQRKVVQKKRVSRCEMY